MTDTVVSDDPVDLLPSEWESLEDVGRALAEANDRNRWLLGDVARKVETHYGYDALGDFASKIKVFAKTLYSYRQVSAFYPQNSMRQEFPVLSWYHYRMALRLGDVDSALKLLAKAQDENWSSRDLTDAVNVALGKPPVRRPLIDGVQTAHDGRLVIADALLEDGRAYTVKVYEVAE